MADTVSVRIGQELYEKLIRVAHQLELKEGRRISMNEVVHHIYKSWEGK